MKNIWAVALVAAVACGPSLALTADEKDQVCPAMGALAKEVMSRRQEGLPMSKLIAALKNDDKTADNLIRSMITAAYAHPQYHTDKVIQQTIGEFQNAMEFECYK